MFSLAKCQLFVLIRDYDINFGRCQTSLRWVKDCLIENSNAATRVVWILIGAVSARVASPIAIEMQFAVCQKHCLETFYFRRMGLISKQLRYNFSVKQYPVILLGKTQLRVTWWNCFKLQSAIKFNWKSNGHSNLSDNPHIITNATQITYPTPLMKCSLASARLHRGAHN